MYFCIMSYFSLYDSSELLMEGYLCFACISFVARFIRGIFYCMYIKASVVKVFL